MWHVSVSLQVGGSWKRSRGRLERLGIALLRPVGGDTEWWWWNPTVAVGHLRVPVTADEAALIPPGCAVNDAGQTGPRRRRTR